MTKRKVTFDEPDANKLVIVLVLMIFGLLSLCVLVASGQEPDTGGWRPAEYQLAQCGPSGCGPSGCRTGGFPQGWPVMPGMNPSYGGNIQRPPARQPQQSAGVKRIASVVFIKSTIVTNAMAGESNSKLGSGTYIGNGYVLTCGHILRDGWNPVVYFANTGLPEKPFPAKIIAADASIDLGLLLISPLKNDADYAMLLAPSNAGVGETVWWAGFGQGSFSAGPGRVTQYVGEEIKINAKVRQGDSGGPLFTSAGLVGVISEGEVGVDIGGACVEYIRQWIANVRGDGQPKDSTATPEANGERPSTLVENDRPVTTVESPATGSGPVPPVASGGSGLPCTSDGTGRPDVCGCGRPFATEAEIKQDITQTVNVAAENVGRQLIDKELVPIKSQISDLDIRCGANKIRVDDIEARQFADIERLEKLTLQQEANTLAIAAIGKGEKGDKGDQGEPGTPCQCDVDAIVTAVLAKINIPNPQPEGITHLVLVRDKTADYWPRMNDELKRARGHYSTIRECDPPTFSTPLPALVAYKGGDAVLTITGLRDVSEALTRISRDEFSLLKEPEHGA